MSNILENIKDSITGLGNAFEESFHVLKVFLLNIELTFLSLSFIVLFLMFIAVFILMLLMPGFISDIMDKNQKGISKLKKAFDKFGRNGGGYLK